MIVQSTFELALKDTVEKLFYMDELIRSESTGTAKELAAKLSISQRHVYNYLKTLNKIGKATRFDRAKNSYVYKETR